MDNVKNLKEKEPANKPYEKKQQVINGLKIESAIAVNNLDLMSPWSCAKSAHTFVNSLIEDASIGTGIKLVQLK